MFLLRYNKFLLRYLGLIIALFSIGLGLVSFSFGILCSSGILQIGSFEFPLGDPSSIIVNRNGEMFCSLQFYQRIQVYDKYGKFLRSWQISDANYFILGITENNEIIVQTNSEEQYIFNSMGKLQSQALLEERNPEIIYAGNSCFDSEGNLYEICNHLIYPHITKLTPKDEKTIFVQMSLYYLLITGPILPWIEILFGFIILAILQIINERIPQLGIATGNRIIAKKNIDFSKPDGIVVGLSIYLILEPLSIILGSLLAIGIILYFHNLQALTFIKVSITVFVIIIGLHIFLHSIFIPACSIPNCRGTLHKISDRPLRYRCKICGNIYTQNTIES